MGNNLRVEKEYFIMKLINLLVRELNNCSLRSDFRVSRHAKICQFDIFSSEINFKKACTCNYEIPKLKKLNETYYKVCTISFERPVNYLCDAWHVFPPKYEAWTHFNRPWTQYQCQGVVWTLLIIFTESVNRSTCLSVFLVVTRLRNVNLLCFSDSIEGIDFLNCTLKCPVALKLANQNRYFY